MNGDNPPGNKKRCEPRSQERLLTPQIGVGPGDPAETIRRMGVAMVKHMAASCNACGPEVCFALVDGEAGEALEKSARPSRTSDVLGTGRAWMATWEGSEGSVSRRVSRRVLRCLACSSARALFNHASSSVIQRANGGAALPHVGGCLRGRVLRRGRAEAANAILTSAG